MRVALLAAVAAMACRSAYANGQPRGTATSIPVTRLRPADEAFTVFSGLADSSRALGRRPAISPFGSTRGTS